MGWCDDIYTSKYENWLKFRTECLEDWLKYLPSSKIDIELLAPAVRILLFHLVIKYNYFIITSDNVSYMLHFDVSRILQYCAIVSLHHCSICHLTTMCSAYCHHTIHTHAWKRVTTLLIEPNDFKHGRCYQSGLNTPDILLPIMKPSLRMTPLIPNRARIKSEKGDNYLYMSYQSNLTRWWLHPNGFLPHGKIDTLTYYIQMFRNHRPTTSSSNKPSHSFLSPL